MTIPLCWITPSVWKHTTNLHIPNRSHRDLSVSVEYCESGHMMYLNPPDAEKLRHGIVEFFRGT